MRRGRLMFHVGGLPGIHVEPETDEGRPGYLYPPGLDATIDEATGEIRLFLPEEWRAALAEGRSYVVAEPPPPPKPASPTYLEGK